MLVFDVRHGEVVTPVAIDANWKAGMVTRDGVIVAVFHGRQAHAPHGGEIVEIVVPTLDLGACGDLGASVPINFGGHVYGHLGELLLVLYIIFDYNLGVPVR